MRDERPLDPEMLNTIRMLAPGTDVYEALEHILRARTGALIVVGDSTEVLDLVNGGFRIDAEMHPSHLYELSKMDGAIVVSSDMRRILYANAQLTPDPLIPTYETGTRHRTAERVAKQTGALVIAISQRRGVISLYRGNRKYVMRDVGVLLAKANQALATLEKYRSVYDQALSNLSALEFEDLATVYDVVTCVQRSQMVVRIADEIERVVAELGVEGRLVSMQLEELVINVEEEGLLVIRDYLNSSDGPEPAKEIWDNLKNWSSEDLLDLTLVARRLGQPVTSSGLDTPVTPRGYRILRKIPRLPMPVVENLTKTFQRLPDILAASIEELDAVEGIGEARAKAIKGGLRRLREQVLLDRHI